MHTRPLFKLFLMSKLKNSEPVNMNYWLNEAEFQEFETGKRQLVLDSRQTKTGRKEVFNY